MHCNDGPRIDGGIILAMKERAYCTYERLDYRYVDFVTYIADFLL